MRPRLAEIALPDICHPFGELSSRDDIIVLRSDLIVEENFEFTKYR
jgi:hypothetical protein